VPDPDEAPIIFIQPDPKKRKERVTIPFTIGGTVELTPELIVQLVSKSRLWAEEVKPAWDIGREVLARVPPAEREAFVKRFYEGKWLATPDEALKG
jgi:DNA-directed RNA polymerase specialized sigma24 family protein